MDSHYIQGQLDGIALQLKESLAQIIVALESDEVLSQMRNDASLYQYKLDYLKKLISQQFSIDPALTALIDENNHLNTKCHELQATINTMNEDYAYEINNIETHCQEYMRKKENEIHTLKNDYEAQIKSLQYESQNNHHHVERIRELEKENMEIKDRLEEEQTNLARKKHEMEAQSKKAEIGKQKYEVEVQSQLKQLQQEFETERQEYQAAIIKMEEDMLLIKNSWQKKCSQIVDESNVKLIEEEAKMKRELNDHIRTLQEGNNIIIDPSQEIIDKKVAILKTKFDSEVESLSEQNQQKEKKIVALEHQIASSATYYQQTEKSIEQLQQELNSMKHNEQNHLKKMEREIEHLKEDLLHKEKQLKQASNTVKEQQRILSKYEEECRHSTKRISNKEDEIATMRQEIDFLKSKKEELRSETEVLNKTIRKNQLDFQTNEEAMAKLQRYIDKQNKEIELLQISKRENHYKLQQLEQQNNYCKTRKKRWLLKLDKLFIEVKKVQKEVMLTKQNIKYIGEVYKTRVASQLLKVNEFLGYMKDKMELKYKHKMAELIDQTQVSMMKEKEYIESLLHEKDNMRAEIRNYQSLIDQKQNANDSLMVDLRKKQLAKAQVEDDLQIERKLNHELALKVENNTKKFQSVLDRTEKSTRMTIMAFTDKWNVEWRRYLEDTAEKDRKLQELAEKVSIIIQECEESRKNEDNLREENKKLKKKYENLKQERDTNVDELMRRLKTQSKLKLELETEIKDLRNQFFKNTAGSNNYNYSFVDHENDRETRLDMRKTRPDDRHPRTQQKSGDFYFSDRDKQLSEIKEMIARTSKMVTPSSQKNSYSPQKDSYNRR